jgi:hypothetical protein
MVDHSETLAAKWVLVTRQIIRVGRGIQSFETEDSKGDEKRCATGLLIHVVQYPNTARRFLQS